MWWKIAIYMLGIIPCCFTASLLLFYFHARHILGHFPSYNMPDPKELAVYNIYEPMINMAGNMWIFSIIIWIIVSAIYLLIKRNKVKFHFVLFPLIANLSAIAIFLSPIMEWFAD